MFVFVIHKNFDEFNDTGIRVIPVKQHIKFGGLAGAILKSRIEAGIINKFIRENDIKFIEVPDWSGLAAFMKLDCKVVIKYNGSDAYFCHLEGRTQKKKNFYYEYLNIRRSQIHIFVSQYTAGVTLDLFRLPKLKYRVLPNAINLENFELQNKTENTFGERQKVFYFGTLIRKKGCLELPGIFNELLKIYPGAELLLAGGDVRDAQTGNESTWQMMVPQFDDISKVKYLGTLPYSDVRKLLIEADVCVFPSYAEAMPMTWLESMAMQKAVVASNIGWAREVIDDGIEGFLVHPADHKGFASRISELLANSELRKTMGEKARMKIESKFDITKVARSHIEIYNSILSA